MTSRPRGVYFDRISYALFSSFVLVSTCPISSSFISHRHISSHQLQHIFGDGGGIGIVRQFRCCSSFFAKRKSKKSINIKRKKSTKSRSLESPDKNPILLASLSATDRQPAQVAGVIEDHRFEQFFYDENTSSQLYQIVDMYERPLLLCNPSLAVMADRKGKEYKLLDRDTRFDFLNGFEEFSLMEPHLITDYEFDAVFIDPPFANVTPEQVARCLKLMSGDKVPLWVAYNSKREDKLLDVMNELECPDLEPKWRLSYKEGVSEDTQNSIWLYGPEQVLIK